MKINKYFSIPILLFILSVLFKMTVAQNIESAYLKIGDNDSIFYECKGSGETLIFIHDGILHREIWDGQFAYFSKNYKVIRYDRRGYGLSSDAKGDYSNLDDLLSLFTQLKIDSACLIACSSGGALAIDFTLQYPEKVEALVLVGAIVGGFSYTNHFRNRGGHLPENFKNDLEKSVYYVSEDPYIIYSENIEAKEEAVKLVKKYPKRVSRRSKYVYNPVPPYKRLSEIHVPALIIVGEYDLPDVHAHAGVINAGINASQRIVIPKAGHLVPFEQPEIFNKTVLNFLK